MRVMVAEDHPFMRQAIISFLSRYFEIIGAVHDGKDLVDEASLAASGCDCQRYIDAAAYGAAGYAGIKRARMQDPISFCYLGTRTHRAKYIVIH